MFIRFAVLYSNCNVKSSLDWDQLSVKHFGFEKPFYAFISLQTHHYYYYKHPQLLVSTSIVLGIDAFSFIQISSSSINVLNIVSSSLKLLPVFQNITVIIESLWSILYKQNVNKKPPDYFLVWYYKEKFIILWFNLWFQGWILELCKYLFIAFRNSEEERVFWRVRM